MRLLTIIHRYDLLFLLKTILIFEEFILFIFEDLTVLKNDIIF